MSVDEPIEVVPAAPDWQAQGQTLRMEVCAALGVARARVEHIGSTAVPGLAAKPVIDLMVGSGEHARTAVAAQISDHLGYEYLRDLGATGREYLRQRTHRPWSNVHVVELNGALWQDNLAFRDFLRTHPEAVREYATAKQRAARRHAQLQAYSNAKASVVLALLERARSWSRSSGSVVSSTEVPDSTEPG